MLPGPTSKLKGILAKLSGVALACIPEFEVKLKGFIFPVCERWLDSSIPTSPDENAPDPSPAPDSTAFIISAPEEELSSLAIKSSGNSAMLFEPEPEPSFIVVEVSKIADPEEEKDASKPTLPGRVLAPESDCPEEAPAADEANVADEMPVPTLFGVGR